MAVGKSGRVVIDIDPRLKRRLYAALAEDGNTLKDWFLLRSDYYLRNRTQGTLFPPEPPFPMSHREDHE